MPASLHSQRAWDTGSGVRLPGSNPNLLTHLSFSSALCKMKHVTIKPGSQAFREDLIRQIVRVKQASNKCSWLLSPNQSTQELACQGAKTHKKSVVFKRIYSPNSVQTC